MPYTKHDFNNLRAMHRMQEKGIAAAPTSSPDVWKVRSENNADLTYTVTVRYVGGKLESECTCKSKLICKHQRLVALEFTRDNRHLIDLVALQERKAAA